MTGGGWCLRCTALAALLATGCGRIGFDEWGESHGDGGSTAGGDGGLGGDAAGAIARHNVVFVSSEAPPIGEIGGIAEADARCTGLASDASLGGDYIAWLSSSTSNAIDRLGDARGWVRPDGLPVLDQIAEMVDPLGYVPLLDETGARVDDMLVTATDPLGELQIVILTFTVTTTCQDYTLMTEFQWSTGSKTTTAPDFGEFARCDLPHRLLCLGVSRTEPLQIPERSGRIAFTSDQEWTPGGGLTAADAVCNEEATTAGLPGTYLAALATTTTSIASRFDLGGDPWVNVNGVRLAATPEAFLLGRLDAWVDRSPTRRIPLLQPSWSGYAGADENGFSVGSATCSDWNETTGEGGRGHPKMASGELFSLGDPAPCDLPGHLLCLQE